MSAAATRLDLVRLAAALFLPHVGWDLDRAIGYAERLATRLEERGYAGGRSARAGGRPAGPRPAADHLADMPSHMQSGFADFWAAYGLKKGKQRAAARWAEIAPDPDLLRQILDAARKEARATLPVGASRKWPEGWLAERRWEDHAPVAPSPRPPAPGPARSLTDGPAPAPAPGASAHDAALDPGLERDLRAQLTGLLALARARPGSAGLQSQITRLRQRLGDPAEPPGPHDPDPAP